MRVLIAECEVEYRGRLETYLPPATRMILVKDDHTVLIHGDKGTKALNWMPPPCTIVETDGRWEVDNPKTGEHLTIHLHEVLVDEEHQFGREPGLVKAGVEAELQAALAANPEWVADGLTLVRREHPTPVGPVDILYSDPQGGHVAVEVKRRGHIDGVDQLSRYLDFMNRDPLLAPVRGVYAAQIITPQARVLAEDRGIECVLLDYGSVVGEPAAPGGTLF